MTEKLKQAGAILLAAAGLALTALLFPPNSHPNQAITIGGSWCMGGPCGYKQGGAHR